MDQDPDTWTLSDAIKLRQFIAENPKFLRALAAYRPKIEGTTMEARAVTGSDANGFMAAQDAIAIMQRDPTPQSDIAGFTS